MKKLLIATTALVATAGMANADITITGHAAAGIHSGLDATAAVAATGSSTEISDQKAIVATAAALVTSTAATVTANTADGSLLVCKLQYAAAAAVVQHADEAAVLDAIDGTAAI